MSFNHIICNKSLRLLNKTMSTLLLYLLVILLIKVVSSHEEIENSEVVTLTSKTFEHLTQAATGHTTGDW